jgi:glycosyltransferase involved in cell wall biosynthesis
VLFRGDSTLLDGSGKLWKSMARKLFLCWVYRHVDYALFVGKANRAYFEAMGLQSNQLHFAPHAIDNIRFGMPVVRKFRQSLGFNENEVVYLFAGKLEAKKNPILLIRAFAALNQPNTRLWLVGDGPQESELNRVIAELPQRVQECIHRTPFVNQLDMPAVYQSADVFVLPSKGPGETWDWPSMKLCPVGCLLSSAIAVVVLKTLWSRE